MSARRVSVALVQITGEPYEASRNREASVSVARDAFARGADIVLLPELVIPGYVTDPARLQPIAETLDGPTVAAWREVAAESGGYVCGGFCEQDQGRLFNTAVLVGREGVVAHYRKLHLFSEEKRCYAPGDLGLPIADLERGRVGLCVCYDLRFVETLRVLSLQGAELALVPTAWVAGFDRVKWEPGGLAPQARGVIVQANLDQVFVACASQAGDRGGHEFLGSSIVVDPRGQLVAGPLPGSEEATEVVSIDLAEVEAATERSELITPRADRRTDVYGLMLGDRRF